jgi:molecular chaperone GrpE
MAEQNDTTDDTTENESFSAPDDNGPLADIDTARAEAADWRDKYLRKLAEFDNFRRRTRQESESIWQRATESTILGLLPVMDDFERMLESALDPDDFYRKGAEMIRDKMRAFFEANGVSKFDAKGKPFDPALHDAIMLQPVAGFPAGTILQVVTPGYMMGDHVLRHAQVIVSAELEESE